MYINMVFAPKTTNLFNGVTVGEAPQLSPYYGEYDNGVNVFNFYDNFAGTQLSGKWITHNVNYVVSNGLNVTGTPSASGWIYTNFNVAPNDSVGFYGLFSGYNNIGTEGSQSFEGVFFQMCGNACNHGQEQFPGGTGTTTNFNDINTNYLIQILNSTTSNYFVGGVDLGEVSEPGSRFPYNVTPFITNGAVSIGTFDMKFIFVANSLVNGVTLSCSLSAGCGK